jgi:serine/threonine protein kinase
MTPPEHIGKYADLNLVGFGTYGSVYSAWDPDLDRYVAIKVMNAQFSQDESSLERFLSEARFMARVDQHPNVVRVIELGEDERGHYMVMDYYSNGNLENLILMADF